ncbi:EscU/YscU/HrcU family type III secretion system export apparatus switch protein [Nitrospinota bacterium]
MEEYRKLRKFIPKEAVALQYHPPVDRAPRVAAKGKGEMAERIVELARIHNVPIREDADLTHLLGMLEEESEIPSALYRIIAEILAFIYFVNEKWKKENAA